MGEQILEVNGQSFVVISHDEAVHILKTGRRLLVKVRDVGRLPHARTLPDQADASAGLASSHHPEAGAQSPGSARSCTSRCSHRSSHSGKRQTGPPPTSDLLLCSLQTFIRQSHARARKGEKSPPR